MQQQTPPAPTPPVPAAPVVDATGPSDAAAGAPDGDAEAQSVEDAIFDGARPAPPAERDKPDWEVEEKAPCPRGPDGRFYCPDGTVLDGSGETAAAPTRTASSGGGAPAPQVDEPASAGGVEVAPMTARDHVAEGDRALARSDYRTAVAAYRQAVQMKPGSAVFAGKLGVALFRSGDTGSARNYLNRGANGGYPRAHEYLGDIAAQQGDSAGAISHYQTYIQTGAGDAARVQQKIDQLSGL